MARFTGSRRIRRPRQPMMTLEERKKTVLLDSSRQPRILARLQRYVQRLSWCVTKNGVPWATECWINSEAKSNGTIQISCPLGHGNSWTMNFGIASLLVNEKLTMTQKLGIIYENWELSHLCGNWRCMNHSHFTVESKTTNLQRMACFNSKDRACAHNPPCLIHHQTNHGSRRQPKPKPRPIQEACMLPGLPSGQSSEDED
jgi:hypothetical protein